MRTISTLTKAAFGILLFSTIASADVLTGVSGEIFWGPNIGPTQSVTFSDADNLNLNFGPFDITSAHDVITMQIVNTFDPSLVSSIQFDFVASAGLFFNWANILAGMSDPGAGQGCCVNGQSFVDASIEFAPNTQYSSGQSFELGVDTTPGPLSAPEPRTAALLAMAIVVAFLGCRVQSRGARLRT